MNQPVRIAFVSCAYATHRKDQPAWKDIRAADPDLLLMLGDNAYMSWKAEDLGWHFEDLEHCYEQQFKVPEFVELIKTVPTLAIWDDHDCGPNDVISTEAPPENLARSRALFNHYMGSALNNNPPHMYCTYEGLPDVKVIMLDVRTHRTRSDAKPSTVLGGAQEKWLWDQLDAKVTPQRKFTLIGSGTGFSIGMKGHRINSYKPFADTLRKQLAFRPGDGEQDLGRRALFLAGDVHYTSFKTHKEERFHEAISSGVACFRATTDDFLPASYADNWGLITIAEEVSVEFFGNAMTPHNQPKTRINISDWTATSTASAAAVWPAQTPAQTPAPTPVPVPGHPI